MVRPLKIKSLTTDGRTEPGTVGGPAPVEPIVRPIDPVPVQAIPIGIALHQH